MLFFVLKQQSVMLIDGTFLKLIVLIGRAFRTIDMQTR